MMANSQGQDTGLAGDWAPRGIDTQTPSTARMYDYYLGGKHHYPADREAAEQVLTAIPDVAIAARENRKFLQRAVRFMTQSGIRQFVDLGTGLPTQENVHQVAQAVTPDAHVVYVDNDPVALAHARALLSTDPQTTVVDADLRRPDQLLDHPELRAMVDLDQPLGILLMAIVHFVSDREHAAQLVATYRDALPSGGYLTLSHASKDTLSPEAAAQGSQVYDRATSSITLRTRDEIQELFAGLEVLEPGVVSVDQWRPHLAGATTAPAPMLAGVGRKP